MIGVESYHASRTAGRDAPPALCAAVLGLIVRGAFKGTAASTEELGAA
jgi:hypothetical protein